jgi:hypothetical protein
MRSLLHVQYMYLLFNPIVLVYRHIHSQNTLTMTSSTTTAEIRIHAIALQLAKTVMIDQDPHSSSSLATNDVEVWMKELTISSSFTPHESAEIVRQAAELASNQKMEPDTTTAAPVQQQNSVSLWDQFQGSSFSEPVLWSDIQQTASTPEHLLALLQKVDHIDDLLGGDWSDACSILQRGLQQQPSASIAAYLELHRKWFGECQATTEYQAVRFDLCRNVWQAASEGMDQYRATLSSIQSTDDELVFDMLQAWQFMWVQIITKAGSDSDDRVDEMVAQVFRHISMIPASQSSEAPLTVPWQHQPFAWLALVDPAASWFQCWLDDTPISRTLPVVASSSIVSFLVERSRQGSSGAVSQNKAHLKSLAMLSALLLQLRVRMFPWDQVTVVPCESQVQNAATTEGEAMVTGWAKGFPKHNSLGQVLALANLFLSVGQDDEAQCKANTTGKQIVARQCRQALEALSSGCVDSTSQDIHTKLVELVDTHRAGNVKIAA